MIGRLLHHRDRDDSPPSDVWVVSGLGNPGRQYADTRHNAGYLVVDELARRGGLTLRQHKTGRAVAAEGRIGEPPGRRVVLMRGHGYMNDSGGPVSAVLKYYRVSPERLVVVHDEIDLPYGDLRIKLGGGDNGHNGLRSVRQSLGTGDFYRVRFGVSRPPGRQDAADYVLRPFSAEQRRDLELHVARAADSVESLVDSGLQATQNLFNS